MTEATDKRERPNLGASVYEIPLPGTPVIGRACASWGIWHGPDAPNMGGWTAVNGVVVAVPSPAVALAQLDVMRKAMMQAGNIPPRLRVRCYETMEFAGAAE